MAKELKHIDISNVPELLRIVEEMRASNEPRVLQREHEVIAILMPAKRRRAPRAKTQTDNEAFQSAFGAWRGLVDVATFKDDVVAARGSDRPPIRL